MARIGFIGLGNMGLPMAINLIKAGHTVTGFDLQPRALNAFSKAGGLAATMVQETARTQNVVITMLQTGSQVESVCLGAQGLFSIAASNTLFIDCSSIDVKSARNIHEQANQHGLLAVDAPVSGGVAGATQAQLTIMVGGTEPAFTKAKTYLSAIGKKIIHTGVAGTGQAAKICNNMILGVSMIAISEAFTLAEHLGLAPQKLFDVVTHSSGQCWAISNYAPLPGLLDNVPANHNYEAGFTSTMMLKDLCLSQQSAKDVGIETHIGAQATELYQQFVDLGMGNLDFSAIIQHLAPSTCSTPK